MKSQPILSLCAAMALLPTLGRAQDVILGDPLRPRLEVRSPRGVHVFIGTPGARGRVEIYDEQTGLRTSAPFDLRELRLLPIDFVGRTELETFFPDRPRRVADVPGAARLVLPAGRGNLYRYERTVAGGHAFGFLHVRPDGGSAALAETAGHGPAGDADPFVDRIAVDRTGTALLIATVPAAGGNLIEVDLVHEITIDRTPHLAPVAFSRSGMWLNDTFGFAVAADGIHRFDRIFFAQTELVPFAAGQAPTWFSGEVAMSANREWAVTTAGTGLLQQHVFTFCASGPAQRASTTAEELSPAGFLPESLHGPYMAVSDDGLCAAWRREPATSMDTSEVFFSEIGPAAPPPVQITDDAYFVDTLEEIGLLRFVGFGQLTMAVGELDAGEIEKVDMFGVTLTAGSPSFVNLTLTNGQTTVPFSTPAMKPLSTFYFPSTGLFLTHDEQANRLLGVDSTQPGLRLLMDEVKDVRFVEQVGGDFLIAVRRDYDPRPDQLVAVDRMLSAPANILDPGGEDVEFTSPTSRSGGWAGYVRATLAVQSMHRVHLPTAMIETLPGGGTSFLAPIGYSELGGQVVTSAGPLTTLEVWQPSGARTVLRTGPVAGHLIPGR